MDEGNVYTKNYAFNELSDLLRRKSFHAPYSEFSEHIYWISNLNWLPFQPWEGKFEPKESVHN